MAAEIKWTALKGVPDTLTLYWKDTPFTVATIDTATPIVLATNATSYTDSTIANKATRYYRVAATKTGKNTQYSQLIVFTEHTTTGPGNQSIVRGTWERGYMDFLTPAQFFSISGLRTALGSPSLGSVPADGTLSGWYKMSYKGKILFIPTASFATAGTLTWPQLYNAGLVYGTNDNGLLPFTLPQAGTQPPIPTGVNQLRTVTLGGATFKVRLINASNLPTDQYAPDRTTYLGSEWYDIVNSLAQQNGNNFAVADLTMNTPPLGDLATNVLSLAGSQNFTSGLGNLAIASGQWPIALPRSINLAAASSWVSWVPILELIET